MKTHIKQIEIKTKQCKEHTGCYHFIIEITVVSCSLGTPDFEYSLVYNGVAEYNGYDTNHKRKLNEARDYLKFVRRMANSLQVYDISIDFENMFKNVKFIVDEQSLGKAGKEKFYKETRW